MVEEEGLAEDLDLDLDCPPPFMQRRREAVACRAPTQAVSTTERPSRVGVGFSPNHFFYTLFCRFSTPRKVETHFLHSTLDT